MSTIVYLRWALPTQVKQNEISQKNLFERQHGEYIFYWSF